MTDALPWIDPTAGTGKAPIARAPRPMDLAGKVVGLLDNTKEQGDVILQTVADALRERYGAKVLIRRKEHYSKPARDALIETSSDVESYLSVRPEGDSSRSNSARMCFGLGLSLTSSLRWTSRVGTVCKPHRSLPTPTLLPSDCCTTCASS